MTSILFDRPEDQSAAEHTAPPPFFSDLNLDQIVNAVTAPWADYNLMPFLCFPLERVAAVEYRHEVFRDLEMAPLSHCVRTFAARMREVRDHLTQERKLYYKLEKQAWFLHAVELYCDAVTVFATDLSRIPIKSRAFVAFLDYLQSYAGGRPFASLVAETNALRDDLLRVQYSVRIHENSFTVSDYQNETDYSAEVEETFEKFKQGAVNDYRLKYRESAELNHIEAKILDFVAQLHPQLFWRLDRFRTRHASFMDECVATFDREIHFYLAYTDYIAKLLGADLNFCYPRMTHKSKGIYAIEGFDLALAQKLAVGGRSVVRNDFSLQGRERVIVVSGPNQGGKTTFARAFGQLHYLASLGCLVPAREAVLFLFDRLFTHFEREEKVETLRGKLEDDLTRIHAILEVATSQSILIMNEIFSSTTLHDEILLSRIVMQQIQQLDLLCVWVTFVDEMASFNEQTVSMVSTIVPENPTLRTFKLTRRPADGLAYAMAIAEKYGLTYDHIRERIAS
jgi:DNA mismatch repair protein MutS